MRPALPPRAQASQAEIARLRATSTQTAAVIEAMNSTAVDAATSLDSMNMTLASVRRAVVRLNATANATVTDVRAPPRYIYDTVTLENSRE